MLSSVLRSKRAVQVNIEIMRAFVRFRELLSTHKELAQKLDRAGKRIGTHDAQFQSRFSSDPAAHEHRRSQTNGKSDFS